MNGINSILQKKKRTFYVRKKDLKKIDKIQRLLVILIYIETFIFLLQNAFIIFYNLYYDYWDLISKFLIFMSTLILYIGLNA
jgi:hypothetical protein